MKRKSIIIPLLVCLMTAAGWVLMKNSPASGNVPAIVAENMAAYNLHVQKRGDDTVWRVWDAGGQNRGRLSVQAGDQINWRADGSPMEFRFHKKVDAYFTYEEDIFQDDSTQSLGRNEWLRVTVREDAPQDSLVYDVYIVDADTFAVGNSPPVLIVY